MDLSARWDEIRSGFSRSFWVANTLELFERLSFYGSKIVLAVFLAETVGLGALGIQLVGIYGFAVFCLPTIAGPFVDRYGFRKSLAACFAIYSAGYLLLAMAGIPFGAGLVAAVGPTAWVVGSLLVTAVGGSLIKPCIVGTVARTTTHETKSLGYSVYYTLVNVGGWVGPILASQIRVSAGIAWVLVGASATSFLLFLSTLAFFREPEGAPEGERRTLAAIFRDAALVFRNGRFLLFLAILSVFWVMFWQVYDLFPFYVRDILGVARFELIGSLESFSVILLTVPVSALTRKLPPLVVMTASFAVGGASWILLLLYPSWQAAAGAMFLLALGEVLQAPRFYEYVADLAPKEQVGTYMGFAFLPVAVGALFAGQLGSFLVTRYVKGPAGPSGAWIVLAGIGAAGTAAMILYDRLVANRAKG